MTPQSIASPAVMGDRRLTLEHLRTLAAIVDHGGLHQAGEALLRTQSAVTQSLRRLEDILGCRLVIRRHGRYLGLTPPGRIFLDSARDILARTREAADAVARPELSGRFRLGVPDDFAAGDIMGLAARFRERSPRLRVETVSTLSAHVLELFSRRELDMAVFLRLETDGAAVISADALRRDIRSAPLCWAAREAVAADRYDELPLVVFPEGCAYRRAALRALTDMGRPHFLAYESASCENIRQAVSAGLGVAALPRDALAADHVVLTEKHGLPRLPQVRLSLAARPDDAAARAFADLLAPP